MEGTIRKLVANKGFGFITTDRKDYFFHRDDFEGHWNDLISDFQTMEGIPVQFVETTGPKGARAQNVKRLDWPNRS